VGGVDLGDEERDVVVHAKVLGVGDDDVAGGGKFLFDFRGDVGVHGGEDELGGVTGLALADGEAGDAGGHHAVEAPTGGLTILLAGGAVRGSDPSQLEPGVIREQTGKILPHHSGGAEYTDF